MRGIWGILNWLMRDVNGEKEANTTTNTATAVDNNGGGEDVVMS